MKNGRKRLRRGFRLPRFGIGYFSQQDIECLGGMGKALTPVSIVIGQWVRTLHLVHVDAATAVDRLHNPRDLPISLAVRSRFFLAKCSCQHERMLEVSNLRILRGGCSGDGLEAVAGEGLDKMPAIDNALPDIERVRAGKTVLNAFCRRLPISIRYPASVRDRIGVGATVPCGQLARKDALARHETIVIGDNAGMHPKFTIFVGDMAE